MSEADYQIERHLDKQLKTPSWESSNSIVDTRSLLERVSISEIKRIALEMHKEGFRSEAKYEKMNQELMNSPYGLSHKQKHALITFIMYAK